MEKQIVNRQLSDQPPKVCRDELVSVYEEVELVKRFREGGADSESAKDRLLFCSRRFVIAIAKKYTGYSLSMDELIEEGNKGLLHAAMKFDESRGFKFVSYATWWIKESIKNALGLEADNK